MARRPARRGVLPVLDASVAGDEAPGLFARFSFRLEPSSRSATRHEPKTYFGGGGSGARVPDASFEYKRLFKGAKVDAVYDAVVRWLRKKGAKIKKAEK